MAVRKPTELLESIRDRFEDDTSDETLALIEDVTDTINDYETRTADNTDWKTKYEENDKKWREKYRDRFFNGNNGGVEDEEDDEEDETTPTKFSDLFTTK